MEPIDTTTAPAATQGIDTNLQEDTELQAEQFQLVLEQVAAGAMTAFLDEGFRFATEDT